MKKLLLIAAATAAISTSAFADATEGTFYLRADVAAQKFENVKVWETSLKTKWNAGMDIGVGYYLMENVRGEVVYSKPFNVEAKKTVNKDTYKAKPDINAILVKVYGDVADLGMAKLFVGGGLGWSMIKHKVSASVAPVYSASSKKKNTLAWTIGLGAGFDLAEGVKGDVQYAYSDFGKTKAIPAQQGKKAISGKQYRAHNIKLGVRFEI